MSESMECVYYGKGFSKGKNNKQKPLSGITVGRGEPIRAALSCLTALDHMGFPVEEALLEWCMKRELHKFTTLTPNQAWDNLARKFFGKPRERR